MPRSAKLYVAGVALLATAWSVMMFRGAPNLPHTVIGDALLLCGLAVAAEFLSFLMPKSAVGSFGFIPYFAAAIIVPSWPSVLSVVLVTAAAEVFTKRQLIKKTLNVSAHALMECIAVSVFLGLGGTGLR